MYVVLKLSKCILIPPYQQGLLGHLETRFLCFMDGIKGTALWWQVHGKCKLCSVYMPG
jgi:hypothetical protein